MSDGQDARALDAARAGAVLARDNEWQAGFAEGVTKGNGFAAAWIPLTPADVEKAISIAVAAARAEGLALAVREAKGVEASFLLGPRDLTSTVRQGAIMAIREALANIQAAAEKAGIATDGDAPGERAAP